MTNGIILCSISDQLIQSKYYLQNLFPIEESGEFQKNTSGPSPSRDGTSGVRWGKGCHLTFLSDHCTHWEGPQHPWHNWWPSGVGSRSIWCLSSTEQKYYPGGVGWNFVLIERILLLIPEVESKTYLFLPLMLHALKKLSWLLQSIIFSNWKNSITSIWAF